MNHISKTLSLMAMIALAGPSWAQDADGTEGAEEGAAPAQSDQAPGGDLSMGQDVPTDENEAAPGQPYVVETFGDWEQRCVRTEDGSDPCQLYQLLRDDEGNAVSEISVFPLPEGQQQAAAGATIITPLETLLTEQITLSVDGGQARRYPFEFCVSQGCFSRVGFTSEEISQFRRGAQADMVIVPAAAPDQQIELAISLNGFTDGYEAVTEANAE